ncbi:MAG: NAD-dependent epimerase/dehydratase family protein [Solirubrobacterales bacterium]
MRVFVAGATGALGRRLVPMLVESGHSVVAMSRTARKRAAIEATGATPVVADALDRDSVSEAVRDAKPEAIVHQLTALTGLTGNPRRFDREFAPTNKLRTEGTDHLLRAAGESGARRFVVQSFAGWPFAREGGSVKTEDDPLDPDPPAPLREALAAIRHLEGAATSAEGVDGFALRYGGFYGPGTSISHGEGDGFQDTIRKRRFPVLGAGSGVWSFVHIDDAASATRAAVEGRGEPGIYNVVDDDPAPVSEWLPALAEALGARPPRRLPLWVGRVVGGELAVSLMTQVRGASNAKAKRELGWAPSYPSWREGFRTGLG